MGLWTVTENCLRRIAEHQQHLGRPLELNERLHEVMIGSEMMIQSSLFRQAIIITVHVPLLTFMGVEGKIFEPMGLSPIIAFIAAFVLSLTFVPAMLAIFVT